MRKKSDLYYVITVLVCALLIFMGFNICKTNLPKDNDFETYKAKVLAIKDIQDNSYSWGENTVASSDILFSAKIINGKYKNKIVDCKQTINEIYMSKPSRVRKGDSVVVSCQISNNNLIKNENSISNEWIFISHNRVKYLVYLGIVFLVIILILGRMKGINTIISLIFTGFSIFLVYIPSVLKGYNIYLMTIVVSVFIIVSTLILINGFNKKTLCAILGNISGVAVSAVLSLLMNNLLKLTGFINEDYFYLQMLDTKEPIDLIAIVWGGVVIGALGAVMDISMSIASSVNELSIHMHEKTFFKLYKSGMNIGRDAIGTMTNTLILAYIGSSFAMVLLLMANNSNLTYIMNTETISVEVSQSLIGSIGILIAVPITTAISSKFGMMTKKDKQSGTV